MRPIRSIQEIHHEPSVSEVCTWVSWVCVSQVYFWGVSGMCLCLCVCQVCVSQVCVCVSTSRLWICSLSSLFSSCSVFSAISSSGPKQWVIGQRAADQPSAACLATIFSTLFSDRPKGGAAHSRGSLLGQTHTTPAPHSTPFSGGARPHLSLALCGWAAKSNIDCETCTGLLERRSLTACLSELYWFTHSGQFICPAVVKTLLQQITAAASHNPLYIDIRRLWLYYDFIMTHDCHLWYLNCKLTSFPLYLKQKRGSVYL